MKKQIDRIQLKTHFMSLNYALQFDNIWQCSSFQLQLQYFTVLTIIVSFNLTEQLFLTN